MIDEYSVLPRGFHPGKSSTGFTYGLVFTSEGGGYNIYEGRWESDGVPPLEYDWVSGKVRSPRAVAYQTLRLRAENPAVESNVQIIDKQGVVRADMIIIDVDRPVRIPGGWRSDEIQIQVSGAGIIESVGVWDSMAEAQ